MLLYLWNNFPQLLLWKVCNKCDSSCGYQVQSCGEQLYRSNAHFVWLQWKWIYIFHRRQKSMLVKKSRLFWPIHSFPLTIFYPNHMGKVLVDILEASMVYNAPHISYNISETVDFPIWKLRLSAWTTLC